MTLDKYIQKRDFKSTAEPAGKIKESGNELIFVVQKHAATNLHYDFRLEMEGLLRSWVIPKGPTLNPGDKRLALMVEDHPYEYKDFEGTIAEGNYGAGNVIIWDRGTYYAVETQDYKSSENELVEGLKNGHINFILKGEKLKGEFSLIKLKGKLKNAWLIIKKNDNYATENDILKENKSVVSSRTLESFDKKTTTSEDSGESN